MQELNKLNRDELIHKMIDVLPDVREKLGITYEDLERATSIGVKRIAAFEEGRQIPKWSEYLSIVFMLWANDNYRQVLDENDLFPIELKKAFSVNRNAHDPNIS